MEQVDICLNNIIFFKKTCMKKEIEEQKYKQDLLNLTIWILQHLSFLRWKEEVERRS